MNIIHIVLTIRIVFFVSLNPLYIYPIDEQIRLFFSSEAFSLYETNGLDEISLHFYRINSFILYDYWNYFLHHCV